VQVAADVQERQAEETDSHLQDEADQDRLDDDVGRDRPRRRKG
jgi:hypothetical protein